MRGVVATVKKNSNTSTCLVFVCVRREDVGDGSSRLFYCMSVDVFDVCVYAYTCSKIIL